MCEMSPLLRTVRLHCSGACPKIWASPRKQYTIAKKCWSDWQKSISVCHLWCNAKSFEYISKYHFLDDTNAHHHRSYRHHRESFTQASISFFIPCKNVISSVSRIGTKVYINIMRALNSTICSTMDVIMNHNGRTARHVRPDATVNLFCHQIAHNHRSCWHIST